MKLFQSKGPSVYDGPPYNPGSRHFLADRYYLLEKDDPILRRKRGMPFVEVEEPPDCDNVESLKELVETCKALRVWTNTVGRAMEWNLKTVGLVFKDHRAIARALVIPRIVQLIDAAVRLGRTERPATDGLDETGALAVLNGVVEWVGEVGEKPTVKGNAIEALLEGENREILDVVQSRKSADDKMRAICGIDRRYLTCDSVQWGRLLGVSAAAIRKTRFWRHDRPRALEAERELRGG